MRRGTCALALLGAWACSHGGQPDIATLSSNSDQVVFEAGQKAAEKKQWEAARQHFKRVIDGFPQSALGPAARLALGDSYFAEGGTASYILAVSQYREFLTLYPSHPRSDYAQFQVAESFFKQKNGPDRDQTSILKALDEFQRLLEIHPGSPFVEQGRERVIACRQSLARAEFLAGIFYQRTRKACRAATRRYQGILEEFPDYQQLDEVLFRLAECLDRMGRTAEALPRLNQLIETFPLSPFVTPARALYEEISQRAPPAPPATVDPSPGAGPTPSP